MNVSSYKTKKHPLVAALQGPVGLIKLELIMTEVIHGIKFASDNEELVRYEADYDCFVFPEYDYDIPARDMESLHWMAEWFAHMSEKTWITKDHIRALAKAVQEHNNLGAQARK